jgi:hypothetical protein
MDRQQAIKEVNKWLFKYYQKIDRKINANKKPLYTKKKK